MLNIIWPIFIIISIIYALISGNIENSSNGIFDSMNSAVNLTITFFGTICLWNGLMEIAKKSSLIKILNKLLSPSINFLFPELKNNFQAKEEISMNIVTNFLGLGNASTPIGLQAMKTLQKDNTKKDTLSNSMIMFIIINIAAIQHTANILIILSKFFIHYLYCFLQLVIILHIVICIFITGIFILNFYIRINSNSMYVISIWCVIF